MASKERATEAIEGFLETEFPGEGLGIKSLLYFEDDGDGTFAFALLSGDSASYVQADGSIRWHGSRLGTQAELAEVEFENAQAERSNVEVQGRCAASSRSVQRAKRTGSTAGLEGAYGGKALEILLAMARLAAEGKSLTIAEDWGFGSATVIDQDGAHTHVGCDAAGSELANFEAFVSQLHGLLVGKRGLAWVKPSNVVIEGPEQAQLANGPARMEGSTT